MEDQTTSTKEQRREQLADIAEHIAVQLVDLSEIAEREGMQKLQRAIDKAVQEAEYFCED